MTDELKPIDDKLQARLGSTWHEVFMNVGVGAVCLSFFFCVVLDALVQVLTTGNLVIRDWEVTCFSGALAIATGNKLHEKLLK